MNQIHPKSISPHDLKNWLDGESSNPILIDVREENELQIAPFPFEVVHFPLSLSSQWVSDVNEVLDRNESLVVLCHAGVRSWNFASWLLQQNEQLDVWNLEGGIDAWSKDVDPAVPIY